MLALAVVAMVPAFAAEVRCPPRLPGPHLGFEQVGPVPAAHWLLWRMRLFYVPRGKNARNELKPDQSVPGPDEFTMIWRPTGNDDLLIECFYNGSGTYYRARSHPLPATCIMRAAGGLTRAWCEGP